MIVAARAAEPQSEEGFAKHVELIINPIGFVLADIRGSVDGFMQEPKAGGEQGIVRTGSQRTPRIRQQISGKVLGEKAVVGQVFIAGPDQVVPVTPGLGNGIVELMPAGFGKPGQIHPVPGPAFSEMRRGQQTVGHGPASGGRISLGIGEKGLHFLGRGRQASEVKMRPSQPGFGCRILSGKQSVGLQFRENETVDVVLRPGSRLDSRRGGIFDRLPAPLFRAPLLQLHGKILFLSCPRRTGFGRPRQPVGDPLLDIGNHGGIEFAFRWHL